ncbi:hypothetical protein QQM79_00800 [Marinobacteraceae bacterium S3BR75-40.1]
MAPQRDRYSQHRYRAALILGVISLVLHLAILWPVYQAWVEWQQRKPDTDVAQSMDVTLVEPKTPEPEPKPKPRPEPPVPEEEEPPEPEQEQHLPRDNADKVDLRGNRFDAPDRPEPIKGEETGKLAGKPQPEAPSEGAAQPAKKTAPQVSDKPSPKEPAARQVISRDRPAIKQAPEARQPKANRMLATAEPPQPSTPAIPKDQLPGLQALDDESLKEVQVGEPFSEIEARRIRMVNKYLEAMRKQVMARWHRPDSATPAQSGEIHLRLDDQGYLEEAWVYLPSGNALLDVSALDAVRAVPRFKVPESRAIAARYYRNLIFSYSGAATNEQAQADELPWK